MFNFFRPSNKITFSKLLLNELYRYALSLCQQSEQAYDLVQSSCEKVLRQKVEQARLKAYMMACIRNEYFDQFRRFKLALVVDEKLQNEQLVNEEVVLQQLDNIMIDKQHVTIILEKLSIVERELLYLWAVEGFSMQEIAIQTNTARGTLLSRLSRLKKRLQNEFPQLVKEVS